MGKSGKKNIKDVTDATGGPRIYAPISLRQFAIMTEIKRTTGVSVADQLRAKVREIEAGFDEKNPTFKIG